MRFLLLFLVALSLHAQTWTDLGTASRLTNASPSNCTNSSPPAYCAGVTFAYADNFASVMTAWSSGVARTKAGSEQMLIFGGGHVATFDNSVYAINLNASPVTVSALTMPSIPTGSGSPVTSANISCTSPNADGTPLSSHTYGQIAYLPVADKMFYWEQGAGNYCASTSSREVWLFNLASNTWAKPSPTGVAGFDIHASADAAWSACALDTSHGVTANESVICEWGANHMLVRYDATANTWTKLTNYASATYPMGATAAVDPARKLFVMFGTGNIDGSGGLKAIKVDISSASYAFTDLSSTLSECSALNTLFPGITYDPYGGNFLVYKGNGDTVYEWNPDTGVCRALTAIGGPTAVNGTGALGRWNYFPTLGKFVNAATVGSDVFAWQPPTRGLGSSTVTCLDKDGDTYGVGPGCAGVDADDTDPAVHTGAQAVTAWSTLGGFLNHKGYNPTRIWYIATTGNNGTCASAGAPVGIGSPCADFAGVTLAAGDAVIYRAGTYTTAASRFTPAIDGTATAPIIAMAYPGELVTFDMTSVGSLAINLVDRDWVVLDGFAITKAGSGGIAIGTGTYGAANTHDIAIRNMHLYVNTWGIIGGGFDRLTIEDVLARDHEADGGEHGIYVGSKGNALSSDITIRRTITYGNSRAGIQVNGNVSNLQMDQNIAYNNGITGFSWENGVHDSYARSNLAFNNGGTSGFAITNYDGKEGTAECPLEPGSICVCTPTPSVEGSCAHNQTGNLIENFTSVQMADHVAPESGQTTSQHALLVGKQHGACSTPTCLGTSLGSNTFRNVALVAYNTDANHSPIVYQDDDGSLMADLDTTTIENYLAYDAGASHTNKVLTHLEYGVAWTTWTCATAGNSQGSGGAGVTLSGCSVADPQFTAYNPASYATPASFDFRPAGGSPLIATGTPATLSVDAVGNARNASAPSLGAYEGTAPPPAPTNLSGRFSGVYR